MVTIEIDSPSNTQWQDGDFDGLGDNANGNNPTFVRERHLANLLMQTVVQLLKLMKIWMVYPITKMHVSPQVNLSTPMDVQRLS